jgi:hypothetical protein
MAKNIESSMAGVATGSLTDTTKVRLVLDDNSSDVTAISALKTKLELDTATPYIDVTTDGVNTGLTVTETFAVGSVDSLKSTALGGGRGYFVGEEEGGTAIGSAWHLDYTQDLSGVVITDTSGNLTDITTILNTESTTETTSETPLFGGTAVDSAILIGSMFPFSGNKIKVATAGTVDPANVTCQYLSNSATPEWNELKWMSTNAVCPFTQNGNVIGASAGREHWRYGNVDDTNTIPTGWIGATGVYATDFASNAVELTIGGTAYKKYWMILRVTTSAIATDPVIDFLKFHTGKTKFNTCGTGELMGSARYQKSLDITAFANQQDDPGSTNIPLSPDISIKKTDNKFESNRDDGMLMLAPMPIGIDTSIPVTVDVRWYPETIDTSIADADRTLILHLDVFKVKAGYVMNALNTSDTQNSKSIIMPLSTLNSYKIGSMMKTTFLFDISDMLPGEGLVGSFYRSGSSDNLDTFGSNVILVNQTMTGTFWR